MSAIKLSTPSSGSISLSPANTASNLTITVPASTSTMLTTTSNLAGLTGVGKVLQVVNATQASGFSTTSTSNVTTGLSASITPSSSSSKVLIIYNGIGNCQISNQEIKCSIFRNGSSIAADITLLYAASAGYIASSLATNYLDSPATTSSTTYAIFAKEGGVPGTVTINAGATLTLMEIAA